MKTPFRHISAFEVFILSVASYGLYTLFWLLNLRDDLAGIKSEKAVSKYIFQGLIIWNIVILPCLYVFIDSYMPQLRALVGLLFIIGAIIQKLLIILTAFSVRKVLSEKYQHQPSVLETIFFPAATLQSKINFISDIPQTNR